MSTYAIQDIVVIGTASEHLWDALETYNAFSETEARRKFNDIFSHIIKGLNITPDTVLYVNEGNRHGDKVWLNLSTDEARTKYTELDIVIKTPTKIEDGQAVTLSIGDTPQVTIK